MNLPEPLRIIWLEIMTFYSIFFTDNYGPSQEKCFQKIGCFSCRSPFFNRLYRPACALPVDDLSIKYLLFTPQNQNEYFHLNWTADSIAASPFNESLPTKVLIPGFNTTVSMDMELYNIKNELLKEGSYNVIIVDWTDYNNYPYIQAVANGRKVGAYTALILKLIKENKRIDFKNVHVIGHSLGAHIAGWVGERLNKVGRITGLDPAGPYFQHAPNEVRLDKTDASFVDIIHTNGGNNIIEGLGLYQAIGDIDFYPNGGKRQPACGESTIFNFLITRSCAHKTSLKYFRTSINRCRFPSVLCDSYENFNSGQCNCDNTIIDDMGFHTKKIDSKENDTFRFYLHTTASSPYCDENTKCYVSKDLNESDGFILYYFVQFLSLLLSANQGIAQFGNSVYSTVTSFI